MEKKMEKKCRMENCRRPYRAKGYCNVHFNKWRRGELDAKPRYKICAEENCRKPIFKRGYCEQHYSAWSASKKPGAVTAAEQPKPAVAEVAPPPAPEAAPAS